MGLVNAKCPSCGADIQLDGDQTKAFCMYCGGQIQVQEAIQKIKIDRSDELKNLLLLVEESLTSESFDLARQQVQKALEIDAQNPEAWLLHLYAISNTQLTDGLGGIPTAIIYDEGLCQTLLSTCEKVIRYSSDDKYYKDLINWFFIFHAQINIEGAKTICEDVGFIHERLKYWERVCYPNQDGHYWGQHAHEEYMAKEDVENLNMIFQAESIALTFLQNVDASILEDDQYDSLIECAKAYTNSAWSLKRRLGLYNRKVSEWYLAQRREGVKLFRSLVPNSYLESHNARIYDAPHFENHSKADYTWIAYLLLILLSALIVIVIFLL